MNIQQDIKENIQKLTALKGKAFADLIEKEAAVLHKMDYQGQLDHIRDYVSGKYDEPIYGADKPTSAAKPSTAQSAVAKPAATRSETAAPSVKGTIFDQFNSIADSRARAKFYDEHKDELLNTRSVTII